jgi:cell division septum initiation protein DivIVA
MQTLQFRVVTSGYDPEQVKQYVAQIQDAYQALYAECQKQTEIAAQASQYIEENGRLREQNALLAQRQTPAAAVTPTVDSSVVGRALVDARTLADKIVSEANLEAEQILTLARGKEIMIRNDLRSAETKVSTSVSAVNGVLSELGKILEAIRNLSYDENAGATQPGLYGSAAGAGNSVFSSTGIPTHSELFNK